MDKNTEITIEETREMMECPHCDGRSVQIKRYRSTDLSWPVHTYFACDCGHMVATDDKYVYTKEPGIGCIISPIANRSNKIETDFDAMMRSINNSDSRTKVNMA